MSNNIKLLSNTYKLEYDTSKCMARVWGYGGLEKQCSRKRLDDSEYCKHHNRRAKLCEIGGINKKGLWLGRVDKPKPTINKSGKVVIDWPKIKRVKIKMIE